MPEQMTETEFDALMKNCCRDGEYVTELPNYDDVYRMFLTIQAQRTALAERDAEIARLEARIEGGERWYLIDGEDEAVCDLEDLNHSLRDDAAQNADDPDYDPEKWIYRTITIDDGCFFAKASDVGNAPCITEAPARKALKDAT